MLKRTPVSVLQGRREALSQIIHSVTSDRTTDLTTTQETTKSTHKPKWILAKFHVHCPQQNFRAGSSQNQLLVQELPF